jgi:hypothetical protein
MIAPMTIPVIAAVAKPMVEVGSVDDADGSDGTLSLLDDEEETVARGELGLGTIATLVS